MEGKRITELRGTGTTAGKGLRFSCHFEENSTSFVMWKERELKKKGGGELGWASLCPEVLSVC